MENVGPSISYSSRCSAITRHSRISLVNNNLGLTTSSHQPILIFESGKLGCTDSCANQLMPLGKPCGGRRPERE